MSTIKCSKCHGQVASDAKKCPHCGSENFSMLKTIVGIIQAGFLLWLAYGLYQIASSL